MSPASSTATRRSSSVERIATGDCALVWRLAAGRLAGADVWSGATLVAPQPIGPRRLAQRCAFVCARGRAEAQRHARDAGRRAVFGGALQLVGARSAARTACCGASPRSPGRARGVRGCKEAAARELRGTGTGSGHEGAGGCRDAKPPQRTERRAGGRGVGHKFRRTHACYRSQPQRRYLVANCNSFPIYHPARTCSASAARHPALCYCAVHTWRRCRPSTSRPPTLWCFARWRDPRPVRRHAATS